MDVQHFREWVRQQSAKDFADLLTALASEFAERGWTVEAGTLVGLAAELPRRAER